jgi:hypothetical protein
MFKKWATLLTPFVLAPLGSLLTPAIARADYSYWIPLQNCQFSARDYTRWSVQITVRSSDNAAHVTRIQFGNGGNDELIRRLTFWESRRLNGVETRYSEQNYYFNPGITNWDKSLTTTWISTAGNRYVNLKLYNNDGRTCTDKVEF